MKTDYYLSNASAETPLAEFARVANAEHRVEECIKRARVRRAWRDIKRETGSVGIIISHSH